MGQSGRPTAHSVDIRINRHEEQCAARYGQIIEAIEGLRGHVSILHNRAWSALSALIGVLVVVCIGMIAFIFTRLPH